jgi:hypothetical protein
MRPRRDQSSLRGVRREWQRSAHFKKVPFQGAGEPPGAYTPPPSTPPHTWPPAGVDPRRAGAARAGAATWDGADESPWRRKQARGDDTYAN